MSERWHLWGLRLLALALAVLGWFIVALEERERMSEKQVETGVTYNSPQGMIILDPTELVRVRVRGTTTRIRNLNPFLVDVVVELDRAAPGRVDVHLGPENVVMPEGLEVVSIEPNVISLHLDREVTRMLPIEPRLVGEPAAGAVATEAMVRPNHAMVSGPESRIDGVGTLSTSPVDLDGHALNFEEQVAVLSPDPLVKVVQPAVVSVRVRLAIPKAGGPD